MLWYITSFVTFSSSLEIEGNVRAVKFHLNRTVLLDRFFYLVRGGKGGALIEKEGFADKLLRLVLGEGRIGIYSE